MRGIDWEEHYLSENELLRRDFVDQVVEIN